jgi:hypothetical protein
VLPVSGEGIASGREIGPRNDEGVEEEETGECCRLAERGLLRPEKSALATTRGVKGEETSGCSLGKERRLGKRTSKTQLWAN